MATGQVAAGYAVAKQAKVKHRSIYGSSQIKSKKTMKQTWKSRFRNWLNDASNDESDYVSIPQIEESRLQSDGVRLQIYKASGGFVVETRGYDHKTDRNRCEMHVITDQEDLGERLGQIVVMEALR